MRFTQDLHVHTALSSCAVPQAIPARYFELCAAQGITTVGFADHFWDAGVPGASNWYRNQGFEHVNSLRRQLPADTEGVRVRFGCETEYCGHGKIGITPQTAKRFDFVLVPVTHFHMKGFTVPADLSDPRDYRRLMLEYFLDVVEMDIATGIAHPFYPVNYAGVQEVLQGISDADYTRCFTRAAEKGVAIELNPCILRRSMALDTDGFPLEFKRIYRIAKDCGCRFYAGSDAHEPRKFLVHFQLAAFAEACGITDGDRFILP